MSSTDAAADQSSLSENSNQHDLSSRPLQAIEDLLSHIKLLASKESFTDVEGLVADNASLKQEIQSRVDETKSLKAQIETLKANSENELKNLGNKHDSVYHDLFRVHREAVAKVEAEKTRLQEECSTIQKTLEEECSTIKKKMEEEMEKTTKTQKINQELAQQVTEYSDQCKEEQQKVAQANNKIQELAQQVTEYSDQCKDEQEKVAQANNKIQELEAELGGKDEQIEENNEKIKEQELSIGNLQSTLGDLEKEKQSLTEQLDKSEKELRRIEGFTQDLVEDDLDEAFSGLQQSWQSCLSAANSCFEENLSDAILTDPGAWRQLKEANQVTHLIALPPSNSPVAKQMRTLLILAILASSLTRHIFTTTYLLEEDDELRQTLLHLAEVDSGKEAFCRSLLLSVSEDKQAYVMRERMSMVVREVLHRVQDLLTPSSIETFRPELEAAVETATQTWCTIQKRRSRFEADVGADSEDPWEWKAIKFDEDEVSSGLHNVSAVELAADGPALVVFPRVYIVDEEKDTPVFPGVLLQKSQTVAADRELEQIRASSPSRAKMSSTRSRRMSATRNCPNGIHNP